MSLGVINIPSILSDSVDVKTTEWLKENIEYLYFFSKESISSGKEDCWERINDWAKEKILYHLSDVFVVPNSSGTLYGLKIRKEYLILKVYFNHPQDYIYLLLNQVEKQYENRKEKIKKILKSEDLLSL